MKTLKDIQAEKAGYGSGADDDSWRTKSFEKRDVREPSSMGGVTRGDDDELAELVRLQPGKVGIGTRVVAYILDMIVVSGLNWVVVMAIMASGAFPFTIPTADVQVMEMGGMNPFAGLVASRFLVVVYFLIIPCLPGMRATLVQRVFGIEIIKHSTGEAANALRILPRAILFFCLPIIFVMLSFLSMLNEIGAAAQGASGTGMSGFVLLILQLFPLGMAFFSPYNRCLHDWLTGTRLRMRTEI
ncbi:MAG: hypothetical protein Alpg2KO_28870 [Alphaproteobacteria bacterium]